MQLQLPVVNSHVVVADESPATDVTDMRRRPLEHRHVMLAFLVTVTRLFGGEHPTTLALCAPETSIMHQSSI